MSNQAAVPGTKTKYEIHPQCKKYTLRDYGFTESKTGKFQFVRLLNYGSENKKETQLKIVISNDLESLKVYTTISLQSINLYKDDRYPVERENLETILNDLCHEEILKKVE